MGISESLVPGLFEEEEDEKEEKGYSTGFRSETSPQEAERERIERTRHIYEMFVEPVIEDLEDEFTTEKVSEEIRPPYSKDEIHRSLEYGVENEGLGYDEDEDMFFSG